MRPQLRWVWSECS